MTLPWVDGQDTAFAECGVSHEINYLPESSWKITAIAADRASACVIDLAHRELYAWSPIAFVD
jgi:hypothetical protein